MNLCEQLTFTTEGVSDMIEWDSPNFGGHVHQSTTGSWLDSEDQTDD